MQQFLYLVKNEEIQKDVSLVGVIDGSGSMSECWDDLCKAWNSYILKYDNVHTIQFDDSAELQKNPKLTEQRGNETNIELGMRELVNLVKSGNLRKNVMIVFITDGVGEDRIETYKDDLREQFAKFHSEGYQFKFQTLATGDDFSHQIVAELKSIIHNSSWSSSILEYVLNYSTDFNTKFTQLRKEVFYPLQKAEPQIQLTPFSDQQSKFAPNQVILSNSPQVKLNGKVINLDKEVLTLETLDIFIRQILAKLIEESARGIDIKQYAVQSIKSIDYFKSKIVIKAEDKELLKQIELSIREVENFAAGELNFDRMGPAQAAENMHNLQQNHIVRVKKYKKPIRTEQTEITQQQQDKQQKTRVFKDYYKEMAYRRLDYYKKQAMDEELYQELWTWVEVSIYRTVEQLLQFSRTHDCESVAIKKFIEKNEMMAGDIIDLILICVD